MTHISRQDADLHYPDGSHRSTPASTSGIVLANFERRLRHHLAAHSGEHLIGLARNRLRLDPVPPGQTKPNEVTVEHDGVTVVITSDDDGKVLVIVNSMREDGTCIDNTVLLNDETIWRSPS